MASKVTQILKSGRVIVLLIVLLFALTSIFTLNPANWSGSGIAIQSIEANSPAAQAGMQAATTSPLLRERILQVGSEKIETVEQYYEYTSSLDPSVETLRIQTNKASYTLLLSAEQEENATEQANLDVLDLGIRVTERASTNLRKGLDLAGGTRVLLSPTEDISADTLDLTVSNLNERLNVYGLSDVTVRPASDLAGKDFIVVEIAGASETEVRELLSQQGKFEAAIANQTVFTGGDQDITYVCRTAECSGINPQIGCGSTGSEVACSFFFSITLSPEAAARQAAITQTLSVDTSSGFGQSGEGYLSEDLVLFLDDQEVDRLRIGASLRGRETTQIQISGSGSGPSQQIALENSLQEMNRLQTIMITGSLPVQLEIVKLDTISPSLGEEFLSNILLIGVITIASVLAVVGIRYRKLSIITPIAITIIAEIVMILGFAALVGWNLDLAAIAGIIIVAGTGVDHLIIITDETLKGEKQGSVKDKIKRAMAIVLGAYLTTASGMLPLWFAGAGLLKGFAFTTIAGISFGVFIARPAFAAMMEILLKEE